VTLVTQRAAAATGPGCAAAAAGKQRVRPRRSANRSDPGLLGIGADDVLVALGR